MAVTIAREAALLARPAQCPLCRAGTEPNVIALPGIRIDIRTQRVWIAGSEVFLSRKEFEVLVYFTRRPGDLVTREQLYRDVWGYVSPGSSRTVESHISRLRCKLERATGGVIVFRCVRGMGWRLAID